MGLNNRKAPFGRQFGDADVTPGEATSHVGKGRRTVCFMDALILSEHSPAMQVPYMRVVRTDCASTSTNSDPSMKSALSDLNCPGVFLKLG